MKNERSDKLIEKETPKKEEQIEDNIITKIQRRDRAYSFFKKLENGKEEEIPIGHIEFMSIENFREKYIITKGHKKYRYANYGKYTVDLKSMKAFLTSDPDNDDEKLRV